jgi:hypothetical protein
VDFPFGDEVLRVSSATTFPIFSAADFSRALEKNTAASRAT